MIPIGPGMLVKCIKRSPWVDDIGPGFGEVCLVEDTQPEGRGVRLILSGWPNGSECGPHGWWGWNPKNFTPLTGHEDISVLERLASNPTNPDAPARHKQPVHIE